MSRFSLPAGMSWRFLPRTIGTLWNRARSLLVPRGRADHLQRHLALVVMSRVRIVASAFALVVPLFAVVDLVLFAPREAGWLCAFRLMAAAVFALLAWPRLQPVNRPLAHALAALAVLLLVPTLFSLATLWLFSGVALSPGQERVLQLYLLMPTVALGGLALFPLSALETGLMALPVLAGAFIGLALQGGAGVDGLPWLVSLWFMAMLLGVAMVSGMSQLQYMESLVHRAMVDPLTGALTRRSGVEALKLHFQLSTMSGRPLAVLFVDIDHFKSINDTFGHDAGDQVLTGLVARLRQILRQSDVVIRWGGEEFVLVLPEMPAHELAGFFARLSRSGLGVRPDGKPLTASVGVAEQGRDQAMEWQRLIELADARMYRAKQGGRARAVLPDEAELPLAS